MKKSKIIMCEKCFKVDTVYNKISWDSYATYGDNYYCKNGKWLCRECYRGINNENK